ncbi:uncharacterized protein [Ptychodera flava]|uniref:uncharacterized protein n=1 Tax=Ptychodera flava TaxID=63121 RepID=UPI003969C720
MSTPSTENQTEVTPQSSLTESSSILGLIRPRRELLLGGEDVGPGTDAARPSTSTTEEVTISREEFQRLLKNQEEMLKKQQLLEEKLAEESRARRKIRPSRKLKSAIHSIYDGLIDADAGKKWDTTKPFGHAHNVQINKEIKTAVQGQMTEDDSVIHVATKTYFMTKRRESKRQQKGTVASFKKKQARRQRNNR